MFQGLPLIRGRQYLRRGLHAEFGGQTQYGMSTPSSHPLVFLLIEKPVSNMDIETAGNHRTFTSTQEKDNLGMWNSRGATCEGRCGGPSATGFWGGRIRDKLDL